jgi:hypothetical protein
VGGVCAGGCRAGARGGLRSAPDAEELHCFAVLPLARVVVSAGGRRCEHAEGGEPATPRHLLRLVHVELAVDAVAPARGPVVDVDGTRVRAVARNGLHQRQLRRDTKQS